MAVKLPSKLQRQNCALLCLSVRDLVSSLKDGLEKRISKESDRILGSKAIKEEFMHALDHERISVAALLAIKDKQCEIGRFVPDNDPLREELRLAEAAREAAWEAYDKKGKTLYGRMAGSKAQDMAKALDKLIDSLNDVIFEMEEE